MFLLSCFSSSATRSSDSSVFRTTNLRGANRGSIKILPGIKLDGGWTSPIIQITMDKRCGDSPDFVDEPWTHVSVTEGCCSCTGCCDCGCGKWWRKCGSYCCGDKSIDFGWSSYTLSVPLSDVVSVVTTSQVVKAQGNSKCGNSDTNCMGKPKGPKTVKVAGQVVERDPEGHFHGKGAQAERHVVLRVTYVPNGNAGAISNIASMTDARVKSEALARNIRPVAIDFALHASNEWNSADWSTKSAEAAQISVAIATLKSIASGGRQPSPEEVKAAVATAPVLAYEPSPARAEEMTYNPAGSEPTASSATVKPFSD